LERRRRRQLFSLENHGHERAHEDDGRRNHGAIEPGDFMQAIAHRPIADLVMVLNVAEEPILRQVVRWFSVRALAMP
jgi:hypothetical protein